MATTLIPKKEGAVLPALRFRVDVWILLFVTGLLGLGLMAIYSATYDLAFISGLSKFDQFFYVRRQGQALALGLVAMGVIASFDYLHLRKFSVVLGLIAVASLVALVILKLAGEGTFGATITLYEGRLQPGELAKLVTVLYLAHWLSAKGERVRLLYLGLVPFSILTGGTMALLISLPELGTALLIGMISFTLFFVAGANLKHILATLVLAGGAFYFASQYLDYVATRVEGWQSGIKDPLTTPDQIKRSLTMLSAGGITGTGLGQGELKYGLPVAHSDFVFAVLAEELGFAATLFVITSFVLLAWRGIVVALNARDRYGYYLAIGVTCWISYQALINLAVLSSVMPVTGVPLPFISHGGTSLLMTLTGIGVLLSVSRDAAIGPTLKQSKSALESIRENIHMRRRDGGTRLPRARSRRSSAQPRADT